MLRFEPSETALARCGGSYGNRAVSSSRGRLRGALLALGAALSLSVACGSSSGADGRPATALASTRAAQREFRALHEKWVVASEADRARLEPAIRAFMARHPSDLRVRFARIYLAWVLIQRGELRAARKLVDETRRGEAGTAHDFAEVARAAILIREGKPEQALEVLAPLDGKLVDAEERIMYGEERVRAALAARRHDAAVGYMLDWLADAPIEDRELLGARIDALLQKVPPASLETSLRAFDAEAADSTTVARAAARDWLRKSIREHLVRVALDRRDAQLARRLLDQGPSSLRRGERGGELSRLAVSGNVVPRVAGRSVGLVLSLGNEPARRRSAEASAGVARALGLPESDATPGQPRLFIAEDSGEEGGVGSALAALAGDGAAVLIAGVDERGSAEAVAYAEAAAIPVIVLEHVEKLASDGFAFSVGADMALQDALLGREVQQRGATSPARVGVGGVACSVVAPTAGASRFPVATWRRDRVDALILLGDASCARDAVLELASAGTRPLLAFGLESAELFTTLATPHKRIAVKAGAFPERGDPGAPEGLARWRERSGRPPSFGAALAHDAALLAAAAVADFALERVDDAREVAALHKRARDRLSRARAKLWTSDTGGFDGARQLPRKLGVIER